MGAGSPLLTLPAKPENPGRQRPVSAAFITNKGLFEPNVMFFGITNSPATFQMMMNKIFMEELRKEWLTVYMDNMLIHTDDSLEAHRKVVHRVLDKLAKHDLFLKPEKCSFEQR